MMKSVLRQPVISRVRASFNIRTEEKDGTLKKTIELT